MNSSPRVPTTAIGRMGFLQPAERLAPEFVLRDRYRVRRPIGRGGMGEVYQATDLVLNREVAVKVLASTDSSAEAGERMEAEARLLAGLRNPGIVPIHDLGILPDGRTFYVMQLIPGRTLGQVLETGTPLRRLVEILAKACEIVEVAHRSGVVHCDLKPSNVLVTEEGEVLIVDWGIACMLGRDRSWRAWTKGYGAPEQARGERVDARTDVFSLGAILRDLLTVAGPSERRWVRELTLVQRKAADPARERRYVSAASLGADLRRLLSGDPVSVLWGDPLYRLHRWLGKRKKAAAVTAVALFLGLCVASAAGFSAVHRRERERNAARERWVAQMRDSSEEYWKAALALRRKGDVRGMEEFASKTERLCRSVEKEAPELADPHYLLGRMYRAQMRPDRALAELDRALSKAPGHHGARFERGLSWFQKYAERVRFLQTLRNLGHGLEVAMRWRIADAKIPQSKEVEDAPAREYRERATIDLSVETSSLSRGLVALLEGDRTGARSLLEKAISEQPEAVEAYEALSRLDPQDAATGWERGLRADRGYLPFWSGLGISKYEDGLARIRKGEDPLLVFAGALEAFEEGMRLDARRAHWPLLLGTVYASIGLWHQERFKDPEEAYGRALSEFEQVMGRGPSSDHLMSARVWIGFIRLNEGLWRESRGEDPVPAYRKAEESLDRSIQDCPTHYRGWVVRGLLRRHWARYLHSRGEDPSELFEWSLRDFHQALRCHPTLPGLWVEQGMTRHDRAVWRHEQGESPQAEFQEALGDMREALRLDSTLVPAYGFCGMIREALAFLKEGEDRAELFRKAIADYDEAIRRYPQYAEFWSNRGSCRGNWGDLLAAQGRDPISMYRSALDDYQEALRLCPEWERSWLGRGNTYASMLFYSLEELKESGGSVQSLYASTVADYTEAIRRNPARAETWSRRGETHYVMGAWAEACSDFEEAVRLNPTEEDRVREYRDYCRARLGG